MDHVSFVSFIWSGVSTTLLGTFAGVALIVHVLILKCSSKQRNNTTVQDEEVAYACLFTTDTVAATGAKTYWEPSRESESDD